MVKPLATDILLSDSKYRSTAGRYECLSIAVSPRLSDYHSCTFDHFVAFLDLLTNELSAYTSSLKTQYFLEGLALDQSQLLMLLHQAL
jgi:hypothetical protein